MNEKYLHRQRSSPYFHDNGAPWWYTVHTATCNLRQVKLNGTFFLSFWERKGHFCNISHNNHKKRRQGNDNRALILKVSMTLTMLKSRRRRQSIPHTSLSAATLKLHHEKSRLVDPASERFKLKITHP